MNYIKQNKKIYNNNKKEIKENVGAKTVTLVSQRLWDSSASIIDVTEKHPFLVAMVDGTLANDNFQYYVVQDALYLEDFGDCLHMLSTKFEALARNEAEEKNNGKKRKTKEFYMKYSIRLEEFAQSVKIAEKALHYSFFEQWNISADGAKQMPNCLLYTSYIKRIVATRPIEQGLAVLFPCFWVYMHVGKCMLTLREQLSDSVQRPKQFDAWIDMYGGDDFESEVQDYISLVNDICKDSTEETLKEMEIHFIMCCKLEHMFWDQAETMIQWPI